MAAMVVIPRESAAAVELVIPAPRQRPAMLLRAEAIQLVTSASTASRVRSVACTIASLSFRSSVEAPETLSPFVLTTLFAPAGSVAFADEERFKARRFCEVFTVSEAEL